MGVTNIDSKPLALNDALDKYSVVLKELGTLKGFKAKLTIKPNTKPQFRQARQNSYALKDAVDKQFKRLEDAGVIESVPHSEWQCHQKLFQKVMDASVCVAIVREP